jgi:hypothetical protein
MFAGSCGCGSGEKIGVERLLRRGRGGGVGASSAEAGSVSSRIGAIDAVLPAGEIASGDEPGTEPVSGGNTGVRV